MIKLFIKTHIKNNKEIFKLNSTHLFEIDGTFSSGPLNTN